MRIVGVVLAIILATSAASATEFDLHAAVQNRLAMDQVFPMLGPAVTLDNYTADGISKYEGGRSLVIGGRHLGTPVWYQFCDGRLVAASGPVSARQAYTLVSGTDQGAFRVFPLITGVYLTMDQLNIMLEYKLSEQGGAVYMTYPADVFAELRFETRCEAAELESSMAGAHASDRNIPARTTIIAAAIVAATRNRLARLCS